MKISNLYFYGSKVKSENITFDSGTIEVRDCDLSNVIKLLTDKIEGGDLFKVGFDMDEGFYYESFCFASCIDEANNYFTLATSGVIEDKTNYLESKND